jgi:hypothetical protein
VLAVCLVLPGKQRNTLLLLVTSLVSLLLVQRLCRISSGTATATKAFERSKNDKLMLRRQCWYAPSVSTSIVSSCGQHYKHFCSQQRCKTCTRAIHNAVTIAQVHCDVQRARSTCITAHIFVELTATTATTAACAICMFCCITLSTATVV